MLHCVFAQLSAAYVTSQDSIRNIAIGARATILEIKHREDIDRLVKANARVENILKDVILLVNEFDRIPGNLELKETDKEEYQRKLTLFYRGNKSYRAQKKSTTHLQ